MAERKSKRGGKYLGEIISWAAKGPEVSLAELRAALKASGLKEELAKDLVPRAAFSRACKALAKQRIIRRVAEQKDAIQFQFTSERLAGGEFAYLKEAVLTLHKGSGAINADSSAADALATLARTLFDHATRTRTGGDISGIVQKVFEAEGDLFPIRDQGGVYFVPAAHLALVGQVEGFLGSLGRGLRRWPIPTNSEEAERSVRAVLRDAMRGLVAEHERSIEGFGDKTRASTYERAAEQIALTRTKIEAYATLLQDEKEQLEASLVELQGKLRAKVEQLTTDD